MYEADAHYFVTVRCFQSRLLLRPSTRLASVLGGVLARAAKLTGVELCGFVAASNHVHLLCRARDGSLSDFMKYFLCNASKKIGRLVKWRGQLWERRFSAEQVIGEAALEKRLKYILAQGVKEGLVRKVSEWPGLSCLPQLLGEPTRRFPFYEWARRWENGKLLAGGERRWADEWATEEELELHPLPHWAGWSRQRRRARVRELVDAVEREAAAEHDTVKGVPALLSDDPHRMPARTKRSPRPLVHASTRKLRHAFFDQYARFVAAFKQASEKFRRGKWSEAHFPKFSFRPWIPVHV
jgi:REP element-mobilizing transposase RayT